MCIQVPSSSVYPVPLVEIPLYSSTDYTPTGMQQRDTAKVMCCECRLSGPVGVRNLHLFDTD